MNYDLASIPTRTFHVPWRGTFNFFSLQLVSILVKSFMTLLSQFVATAFLAYAAMSTSLKLRATKKEADDGYNRRKLSLHSHYAKKNNSAKKETILLPMGMSGS